MGATVTRAAGIDLSTVIADGRFFGSNQLQISSVCSDSRKCQPGDLFVALTGTDADGHDFAKEAVNKGAIAVLSERMLPLSVPSCIVDDTRIAFGEICHALAGKPSDFLRVIGITGTHGKTSTAMLITAILEAADHQVGMMTSLGYCDADRVATDVRTTPRAAEIAHWMTGMANNGCSHAVMEASSKGLARHHLAGTKLDAAVFTNVRRAHLEQHGSVHNYRQIKARLLDYLSPEGVVVINADDPGSTSLLSKVYHPTMTIGLHQQAELMATVIEQDVSEQTFLLHAGTDTVPIRTPIIGSQHVYNCLEAAALGLMMGVDLHTIVRGIESLKSIPGRFERIECGMPFATFVDAASNADALARTLASLRTATRGRLICVYGASGDGDKRERPLIGRAVERNADLGIITSNNPGHEEPLQIAHDILDGCDRPGKPHIIPDRARAIGWALHQAKPGDTVVITGRGSEKTEIVGGSRNAFDDREVARYFLQEMGQKLDETRCGHRGTAGR